MNSPISITDSWDSDIEITVIDPRRYKPAETASHQPVRISSCNPALATEFAW